LAGYIPKWFTRPQTVTHPSTNRVWRSATTLIEANALPLSQTANRSQRHCLSEFHASCHCYWRAIGSALWAFKEPIVGLLKFKMAKIRHLENHQISISQRKVIRFWWYLVDKCRAGTRWQSCDQIWKFIKFKTPDGCHRKFKMADGRHISNR